MCGGRMENDMKYTENLIKFIENSPSPFHVCDNLAKELPAAGYVELNEAEFPARPENYFL